MSILLETTLGDVVIDLDIDGSPLLSKNVLKLVTARYYTNTLIYNVVPGRYCQMGDPRGDGKGGCSIHGLIDSYVAFHKSRPSKSSSSKVDVTSSQKRFLQSKGRRLTSAELSARGTVVAMEMGFVPNTIGSQFLITLGDIGVANGLLHGTSARDKDDGSGGDDGGSGHGYLSLGKVAEDPDNVLSKLDRVYCDDDGRPYADIRIVRALVVHDPFHDHPEGFLDLLRWRGVQLPASSHEANPTQENANAEMGYSLAPNSPDYERPPEEIVPLRIKADHTTLFATAGWDDDDAPASDANAPQNSNAHLPENDDNIILDERDLQEMDPIERQKRLELQRKQEEEWKKREDNSRAVVLEMLGDLPSADIRAPENVLFVCKLNPLTNDEDLELIFARFDPTAKAEIIRDPDTKQSLQYAFVEFSSLEACNEAYIKMNNTLVDDRRIRVDFSQSVAKVWDRFQRRYRRGLTGGVDRGFLDNDGGGGGGGRGGRFGGRGRGRGFGRGGRGDTSRQGGRGMRQHESRQTRSDGSIDRNRHNDYRDERHGNSSKKERSKNRHNNDNRSRHDNDNRGRHDNDNQSISSGNRSSSRDSHRQSKSRSRHKHRRRSRSRSESTERDRRRRQRHREKKSRHGRSHSRDDDYHSHDDDYHDDRRRRKKRRKHHHSHRRHHHKQRRSHKEYSEEEHYSRSPHSHPKEDESEDSDIGANKHKNDEHKKSSRHEKDWDRSSPNRKQDKDHHKRTRHHHKYRHDERDI